MVSTRWSIRQALSGAGRIGAGRTGSWKIASKPLSPRLFFRDCSFQAALSPISSPDREGCRAKGRGDTFKPKSSRKSFGMQSAPPHPLPPFFARISFQMSCSPMSCKDVILRCLAGISPETQLGAPERSAARRQGSAQNSSMFYFNISVKLACSRSPRRGD